VLVHAALVRNERGRTRRILGTMVDLSERAAAEDRLRRAHDELTDRQAFTDTLLDSVEVGIVGCDPDGRLTVFNGASRRWHGLDADGELAPATFAQRYALYGADGTTPLDTEDVPLLRALRDGAVRDAEIVIAPHGQPATRVLCSGRRIFASDGRVLGAIVAMHDITELRAQTLALRESEVRFRAVFSSAPIGMAVIDRSAQLTQVNRAFAAMVERSETKLLRVGTPEDLFDESDRAELRRLHAEVLAGSPTTVVHTERRLRTGSGRTVWALISFIALPGDGAEVLVQVQDITERRAEQEVLTRHAFSDAVTGLPNRLVLQDRLHRALERGERRSDARLALLFVDLDGFKEVNDTHGHAVGDAVLLHVAQQLRAAVRPIDTVTRLGGDEFVVFCEDLAVGDEADVLASRLRDAVATPLRHGLLTVAVRASIGVAHAGPGDSAETLLQRADEAMYEVKLGRPR
jgi:diguanylate cyclase (GGDEF)-like protein/PAS domain S-box-containing protein